MADQIITCIGCGGHFLLSEGEQGFLRGKFGEDFVPPKRCKACRKLKKQAVEDPAPLPRTMRIWIMVGASGAGKSTYIEENAHGNIIRPLREGETTFYVPGDVVVLSADDLTFDDDGEFRVSQLPSAHAQCLREFHKILSMADRDRPDLVVVDNTNASPWEVSPYVAAAEAYGISSRVLVLSADWRKCVHRTSHDTPAYIIRAQARRIEKMMDDWPAFWPKPDYVIERTHNGC